ncbi:MAG: hypothetical protein ACRDG4_11865, partial [Chloroflexota bacterium]
MQRNPMHQTRAVSRLSAYLGLRSVRWWAVILMVLSLGGPWSPMNAGAAAAPSVTLKTGGAAGQPVGNTITWTAAAAGMKSPVYQFSVTAGSGTAAIVRDFSKRASFKWTPMHEGPYTITATAEDGFGAAASVQKTITYTVVSRVKSSTPVVSATANPLVVLFSAPACASGTLTVQFRPAAGTGAWQSMGARPCVAGQSVNVLVAGLTANTKYAFQDVVAKTTSAQVSFTTGMPDPKL